MTAKEIERLLKDIGSGGGAAGRGARVVPLSPTRRMLAAGAESRTRNGRGKRRQRISAPEAQAIWSAMARSAAPGDDGTVRVPVVPTAPMYMSAGAIGLQARGERVKIAGDMGAAEVWIRMVLSAPTA